MASLPYPRSHKTIFPQNAPNSQKQLAEKKNLCTSVQSVGGSSPPEASVKICAICGRISSARNFCEFREFRGRTYANKLGMGSVEGIRRAAWVWHPCHTHAATKLSSHRIHGTHRNNWRRRKNLCTSVQSVGGSSPPVVSVYSVKSVGEYPPPEISVNSVNSVGGLA